VDSDEPTDKGTLADERQPRIIRLIAVSHHAHDAESESANEKAKSTRSISESQFLLQRRELSYLLPSELRRRIAITIGLIHEFMTCSLRCALYTCC